MFKGYQAEDFSSLKNVITERLKPDSVLVLPFITVIFGFLSIVIFILGNSNEKLILLFKNIELIWTMLMLIVILFYRNKKRCYKYQKMIYFFLCLSGLKLPFDIIVTALYLFRDNGMYGLYNFMVQFSGIAFVFLIISTIRAFYKSKKGDLTIEGRGLYDFKDSKIYISFSTLFSIILIMRFIIEMTNDIFPSLNLIILAIGIVLVVVGLIIALPEFFLIFYCICKFEEFKVYPNNSLRSDEVGEVK